MDEIAFRVTEEAGGGFVASAVGESIFTGAENLDELRKQVLDAIRCHFDEDSMPSTIRLEYSWPDALGECVTLHVPSISRWFRRRGNK